MITATISNLSADEKNEVLQEVYDKTPDAIFTSRGMEVNASRINAVITKDGVELKSNVFNNINDLRDYVPVAYQDQIKESGK